MQKTYTIISGDEELELQYIKEFDEVIFKIATLNTQNYNAISIMLNREQLYRLKNIIERFLKRQE